MIDLIREDCIRIKDTDTELDICVIPWGPEYIEQEYDVIWAALPTLLEAEKAERDGCDGIVIYCAGDPGLKGIRERLSIPVVGLMETSVAMAKMLSSRFSVLTTLDGGRAATEHLMYHYGAVEKCVSVRTLKLSVTDLYDQEQMLQAAIREAEAAVKADGAEAIILGCGMMCGLKEQLTERYGIPLIEPGPLALKLCEDMITLRLTHSQLSYPEPQEEQRTFPK